MALYLIATPIGNLSDMSPRALQMLTQATIIAAEDTRSARRLLAAFNVSVAGKQLVSYGEHNEKVVAARLTDDLKNGKDVALISEGGTPLISDPGFRLVRAAIGSGVTVIPIPGACATLSALTGSGLPVHGFIFRGFLPKKPGARRRILESLKDREETLIFYESPQRVAKVLLEFVAIFGADRPACLARELTKLHETFLRLPLIELAQRVAAEPLKGECTLLVAGLGRRIIEDSL
ncbi:MAG: 16S rRNA (cytidine(1402)-2'-O)-methyltransferase [Planctomycetota bacterium]